MTGYTLLDTGGLMHSHAHAPLLDAPHKPSLLPNVLCLHDEATLLVGRVSRRRVGDGHGGSVRTERRQHAIGRLHGQAEGAFCRKVRLKTPKWTRSTQPRGDKAPTTQGHMMVSFFSGLDDIASIGASVLSLSCLSLSIPLFCPSLVPERGRIPGTGCTAGTPRKTPRRLRPGGKWCRPGVLPSLPLSPRIATGRRRSSA